MRTDRYTIDGVLTVSSRFDSVDEMVDHVGTIPEKRLESPSLDEAFLRRQSFLGRRFAGGWAQVYDAARRAWPKGLEVVDRMLADVDDAELPRPVSRRRRTRFSEDDGDELDYDRFREGRDYWRSARRQSTRGPATITLLVDVGANCRTKHNNILWRGAAAIALTKRLEGAGFRVELWAVERSVATWHDRSARKDVDGFHAVCLKRPGDPIDPSTLASAVSGWFFRTVFFRAMCDGEYQVHGNLGKARPPRPEDLDQVSRDPERIVIQGAFTYEDAVSLVRSVLSRFSR